MVQGTSFEHRYFTFLDIVICIFVFRLTAELPILPPLAIEHLSSTPLIWHILLLAVMISINLIVLAYFGSYSDENARTPQIVTSMMIRSFVVTFILIGFFLYSISYHGPGRRFIFFYLLFSHVIMMLVRFVVFRFFLTTNLRTDASQNILLSGDEQGIHDFLALLRKHEVSRYSIKALLHLDSRRGTSSESPAYFAIPIIDSIEKLEKVLQQHVIDEVIFSFHGPNLPNIEKWVLICEKMGVTIRLIINFFELTISTSVIESFFGLPMITYTSLPLNRSELLIKRIIDIVASFIGIILLLPLFGIIAVAIKLDNRGPVFYKQTRLGQYGRKFTLYKFRSMIKNADELKPDLLSRNEMQWPVFKMKNDPRVTRVGKVLRRYSLDELPQILNVLKGEISLVGPRPALPEEAEHYDLWHRRRLSMKPGITCLWQISGRNEIDFEAWMQLDLDYIDNWSLWLDFVILLRTVPAIVSGRGAS